jgi:hypothetical protein
MSSLSIAEVLTAISDHESLILFNTIAVASGSTDTLKSQAGITRKQYYSRISKLTNAGLVTRKNRNHFLTSFGKIVYDAQKIIAIAVENYWKLKALDSFQLSPSAGSQLPIEEYHRIIGYLFGGNNEIKKILLKCKNKNDSHNFVATQKEENYIPVNTS